jgi:AAA domain/CHC2 zinc finger
LETKQSSSRQRIVRIEEIVDRLNAKRNGTQWRAKCPAHDDRTPSLSISEGRDGRVLLKCHAGCGLEDILAAAGLTKADLFPEQVHRQRQRKNGPVVNPGCAVPARTPATPPNPAPTPNFDWQTCVAAVDDNAIKRLAKLRGYSPEFCRWLKKNNLIGILDNHFAFPVHANGKVVGAHVRHKTGWCYTPSAKTELLIIGDLHDGDVVHVFESQWDGLAFIDVSGELSGIVVTRGASNGALVAGVIPQSATVYLWPQNDEPGQQWAETVCANTPNCVVKIARTPDQHGDLNDWTRSGATVNDLLSVMTNAETAREPERVTVLTVDEILALPKDEHACILGDRLLAKGQSLVIAGQPGLGKTKLALQLPVACIVGRDFCRLVTHGRRFRWLVLQTENGVARVQDDLAALKKWAGPDFDQSLLYVQVVRNDNDGFLCLDDKATVTRISNTIQWVRPDVIIADPLRDFGIGNLDSDADMIATLRELSRLVRLGNPDRALVVLHHALTGRAGAAKAFGLERAGFARNSKALLGWARAQINVIPGQEDSNEILVLTCGKNSNGKEFPPVAVRRSGDGIYEVADDFDIDSWRQEILSGKARRIFSPNIVTEIHWPQRELEKKQLAKLIVEEIGCGKSRAYSLIDDAAKGKIIKFTNLTRTYAKR